MKTISAPFAAIFAVLAALNEKAGKLKPVVELQSKFRDAEARCGDGVAT